MLHYSKQQCLDMDWSNPKEISADKIAYCIHTHDIDIERVPDERLKLVTKELLKLQKQENERKEIEAIKYTLTIYEHTGFRSYSPKQSKEIDHYLDPNLFHTWWEAETAMMILSECMNQEQEKIEVYLHTYKDGQYSKDFKRMQDEMEKVKKKYIKLGGNEAEFQKYVSQIPRPQLGTLKQDIYAKRESIVEQLRSINISPTRAKKIATAITARVCKELK